VGHVGLTVVAFYGPKPDDLSALLASVQQAFAGALGAAFRPRPVDDVHATVIGLEDAPGCADDVAAFLAAELRRAPLEIRFGGFSAAETFRSRGRPLRERSALLDGERAVVIGWPVEHGRPTARLGELRRDCARFGVIHKYHRGTSALDPDAYLVLGDVDADVPPGAAEAVRAAALGLPTSVRLTASDVSVVNYVDPALPRESSTWRPLP
jgi:hypothetical protein